MKGASSEMFAHDIGLSMRLFRYAEWASWIVSAGTQQIAGSVQAIAVLDPRLM